MKNLIFAFVFTLSLHAQAQNDTLIVNIQDVCGSLVQDSFDIYLFWNKNGNLEYIKSAVGNPGVFTGVFSSLDYNVLIKQPNATQRMTSAKDLILAQRNIYGLFPFSEFDKYVADVNDDGKLTASDLGEMKENLLGTREPIAKNWDLVADEGIITVSPNEFFVKASSLTKNTLNLTAIQKGFIEAAEIIYCNGSCIDDSISQASLFQLTSPVLADEIVTIPIYLPLDKDFLGADVTLKINNAEIISVTSNAYIVDGSHIRLVWTNPFPEMNLENRIELAQITLKAKNNSWTSSMISLDKQNYPYQAFYLQEPCIISTQIDQIKNDFDTSIVCKIIWPENITLPNCVQNFYTGRPTVEEHCSQIYFFTYNDIIYVDCVKKVREWSAFNWITSNIERKLQIIYYKDDFTHECNQNYSINLKDGPKFLKARDFIVEPTSSHQYSFSKTDPSDSIIFMKYEAPLQGTYYVYDLTDSVYCIAGYTKQLTDFTGILEINPVIKVHYNNGFKILATDFSSLGPYLPSEITDMEIAFENGNFVPSVFLDYHYSGDTIPFRLQYKKNGVLFEYGTVQAIMDETNVRSPLIMNVYDDYLEKGQNYEMNVYSSNFSKIMSFQFALHLNDVDFVTVEEAKLTFPVSNFNFISDKKLLNLLWYNQPYSNLSISGEDALMVVKLTPLRSGYLSSFISLDSIDFRPEASNFDNNMAQQMPLEFIFLGRPSSSDDESFDEKILLYPNPVSDSKLNLVIPEKMKMPNSILIYDQAGNCVSQRSVEQIQTDSKKELIIPLKPEWPSGLYHLQLSYDDKNIYKKFIFKP